MDYYQKLYSLTDDELKKEGFSRQQVEDTIISIKKDLAGCLEEQPVVKPVTAEEATEITEYYKKRMDKIAVSEETADNKIYELKELRLELRQIFEVWTRV